MTRRKRAKYKGMSRAEKRAFVAERSAAGFGPSQIAKELGYRSHSTVSTMLGEPETERLISDIEAKKRNDSLGLDLTALDEERGLTGLSEKDVLKLALVRRAEILMYGTFHNRPVDPKDGLKVMLDALDRDPETAKPKGKFKGGAAEPNKGPSFIERFLAESSESSGEVH